MEWAWLIPVVCFAAAPIIVVAGPFLPGKGASLSILAIAAGFGLFWVVLAGFLGAGPASTDCFTSADTGSLTCPFSLKRRRNRPDAMVVPLTARQKLSSQPMRRPPPYDGEMTAGSAFPAVGC